MNTIIGLLVGALVGYVLVRFVPGFIWDWLLWGGLAGLVLLCLHESGYKPPRKGQERR